MTMNKTEAGAIECPIRFNAENARAINEGRKWQTRRPVTEPLQIHLPQRVTSDLPTMFETVLLAPAGVHDVKMNQHGAVFIPFPNGPTLGVKPSEFEWVSPYGKVGDRLWVQEPWRVASWRMDEGKLALDYQASPELVRTPWLFPSSDEFNILAEESTLDCQAAGQLADAEGYYHWERGHSPCRWRSDETMPRWAARTFLEVTAIRVERVQAISEEDAIAEGVTFDGTYWRGGPHRIKGTAKVFPTAAQAYCDRWDAIYAERGFGSAANPWVRVVEFKRVEGR